MLQERQNRIIKYLSSTEEWVKGKELAKVLSVTDRTIRTDILEINNYFNEEVITSLKGKGYRLNHIKKVEVKELSSDIEMITNKERILYILKRLIVETEGCNIFDLSEALFISESTIQSDILKIKKVLSKLAIDYAPITITKEVVTLNCDNVKRYGLLYEVAKFSFIDIKIDDMQKYFEEVDLSQIYRIVRKVLEDKKYESRYLVLTKATLYIALIIEAKDKLIYNNDGKLVEQEYKDIVKQIIGEFKLNLNDKGIEAIAYKFEINKGMHTIENNIRKHKNISEDEYSYYREKLLIASKMQNLGLEKYENLFFDLTLHIMVGVERIKRGIKIHNPLRKNIRDKNPFAFWLAKYLVIEIEKEKNITFDFNELSFIAAYISVITNEESLNLRGVRPIDILLVVSDGRANLNYIHNELKFSLINENVNISTLCRFNELKEKKDYDLVIATSKEDAEFISKKYLVIRKNFDGVEKSKILNEVNRIKKKLLKERLMETLKEINLQVIKEKECQALMERVKENNVSIYKNGIEFVYSLGKWNKSNRVCFAIPEYEVKYQEKVKVLFIISKGTKDIKKINWLISYVINLSNNPNFLEGIRLCGNYNEVTALISRLYLKNLI
ncbi:MAG: BglG family transcription antiterminator [Clostridium sp.]